MSPKLACLNKWRRIERLQANKLWLSEYRAARTRRSDGDRDVVFPAGTYQLRVLHGVKCAAAPA